MEKYFCERFCEQAQRFAKSFSRWSIPVHIDVGLIQGCRRRYTTLWLEPLNSEGFQSPSPILAPKAKAQICVKGRRGTVAVVIYQADMTSVHCDAIVNAANGKLLHAGKGCIQTLAIVYFRP